MFRFGQRLSTILGLGDKPLTPEQVSGLDHYDLELEDALSGTTTSSSFPNSWLTANSVQYVFVDQSQQVPSWTLLGSNGSDLAIHAADHTVIDILTDGYYIIHFRAQIAQTAVATATTVGLILAGVGPQTADSTSAGYNYSTEVGMVVPAAFPQNFPIADNSTFGPFKSTAGDTVIGDMQLDTGTVSDNFTFNSQISVIRCG